MTDKEIIPNERTEKDNSGLRAIVVTTFDDDSSVRTFTLVTPQAKYVFHGDKLQDVQLVEDYHTTVRDEINHLAALAVTDVSFGTYQVQMLGNPKKPITHP